jgi:hypothetical protein
MKAEASPARTPPREKSALRPDAPRPIGSRRGAEAQRIVFVATTRSPLTFAPGEGLKDTRLPQTPRNGRSASAGRKRNPSAPPRLRTNKILDSRGVAEPRRNESRHVLIQQCAHLCLVPAMRTPPPHDAPPRVLTALRSGAARPISSRRGAEAQRSIFAAATRGPLTFALGERQKEAGPPRTPRNGCSASANRKHNPSAPLRLRANKFFCSREAAETWGSDSHARVIQRFPQSCSPSTIHDPNPNPKKDRKFPATPCPAGNFHQPRLARVAA